MSSFYEYFKENMEGMGLPAPESLFGSVTSAVATASTLLGQIEKFGERVTISELLRAGTKLEQLAMIGACSAAFYAGAVIGSIAVATGRALGNGTTLRDVLFTAQKVDLMADWLAHCLHRYPGMYQTATSNRASYRFLGHVA
ncbi:hypothetical protein [Pseudomonas sp. F3-2]|uniref:hypothetical protein n=1 Tax=Pseudomonas sp. F3-2 TaxID=3141539 RepID=UPI00315C9EFD